MINYTYILECRDGTYYTGWTNNLSRRLRSHNSGKGSKYTRSRLPVKLIYYHSYPTKNEAMKEEYRIKQLSRSEKSALINSTMNMIKGGSLE